MNYKEAFEERLNHLHLISDTPELRSDIENFIIEKSFEPSDIPDDVYIEDFENDLCSLFINTAQEWHIKYGVSFEAIMTYFSMDVELFSKIDAEATYNFDVTFDFLLPNKRHYLYLNGHSIAEPYHYLVVDAMDFLKNNIEILPFSTQRYVNNTIEAFKDLSFNNNILLNNDFETRLFVNSLEETPNMFLLEKYSNFFFLNSEYDMKLRAVNFLHFFEAVNMKYPNNDTKALYIFKRKLFDYSIACIDSFKKDNSVDIDIQDWFFRIIKKISKNDISLDFAFDWISENDCLNLCVIFSEYVRGEADLEIINSIFEEEIKSRYTNPLFNFKKCPEEIKKLFIEEAKRQYSLIDDENAIRECRIPEIDIEEDEIPF